MLSSLKKHFVNIEEFKEFKLKLTNDEIARQEKMEMQRQIKQANQKTQDIEGILN
jgi:hypothetical protein